MKINGVELSEIIKPINGKLDGVVADDSNKGINISAEQWTVTFSGGEIEQRTSSPSLYSKDKIGTIYRGEKLTLTIMICCSPYTVLNAVINQILSHCVNTTLFELDNISKNFLGNIDSYKVVEFQNGRKYKLELTITGWVVGEKKTDTFSLEMVGNTTTADSRHIITCNGTGLSPMRMTLDKIYVAGKYAIDGICHNPVTRTNERFDMHMPVEDYYYVSENNELGPYKKHDARSQISTETSYSKRIFDYNFFSMNVETYGHKLRTIVDGIEGITYTIAVGNTDYDSRSEYGLATWPDDTEDLGDDKVYMTCNFGEVINGAFDIFQGGACSLVPGRNTIALRCMDSDPSGSNCTMDFTIEWYEVYI